MSIFTRPIAFLTPVFAKSLHLLSSSFISPFRVTYTASSSLQSQFRTAPLMRYALTALLLACIILSASRASVRALLPRFRNSGTPSLPGTEYVTAFSTVPNEHVAEQISQSLVSTKLVACVNTIPGVKSTYWWDGKVQQDTELLLMIKTTTTLVPRVIEQITKLHPYDVPEVIVHPIAAGHTPYLDWIGKSTQNSDPK